MRGEYCNKWHAYNNKWRRSPDDDHFVTWNTWWQFACRYSKNVMAIMSILAENDSHFSITRVMMRASSHYSRDYAIYVVMLALCIEPKFTKIAISNHNYWNRFEGDSGRIRSGYYLSWLLRGTVVDVITQRDGENAIIYQKNVISVANLMYGTWFTIV